MKLFVTENTVGIFRGFSEGGLEFHADLVLPYRSDFQRSPMHGQFLVVELEDEDEGVLGRITSIASQGRLASGAGEDYGIRAVAEDRPIPEDLREQYLKYRVNIRVLGVLRIVDDELVFAASHRRLPHVGSRVAFLADQVLQEVAGHNLTSAADIGFYALGEFVYAAGDERLVAQPWMRVQSPRVVSKFCMDDLVSRRTLVFARAGFGKSNLVKLLFSNLYAETPMVAKRGRGKVPVGTIIFDPDGEYFWPDDKNRPGLCDVPALEDKVVVFTSRTGPSPFYHSFVAGDIKLDIRRLRPRDVISIALAPERQDQQNVRKLKGMNAQDWRKLVDVIHKDGNAADGGTVRSLLRLEPSQEAEMIAARANMTTVCRMLHNPNSQLMDVLFEALAAGKVCIVDVSRMRGTPALILSGLILRKIFDHNQEEFTAEKPRTIPVIAVIEEAQAVLGSGGSSAEGAYVTWVKEGRKFDLGAVLVTQQPGSITNEILSQGDNWFIFHLLSAGDLRSVRNANAHFSNDILSSLLNEPIPGHGVFWSSVGGKSYPIPVRVLSFEGTYRTIDRDNKKGGVTTAAVELRERFTEALEGARTRSADARGVKEAGNGNGDLTTAAVDGAVDKLATYEEAALESFQADTEFCDALREHGKPWMGVQKRLEQELPDVMSNRGDIAYGLVPRAMDKVFGRQGQGWKTERRDSKSKPGDRTTWIVVIHGLV